uniref:Myelin protein zero-like 1 like n=1 Tax=Poecilia latipinna TaxID=48699 RepID=A0A3B3U9X0_9TELE
GRRWLPPCSRLALNDRERFRSDTITDWFGITGPACAITIYADSEVIVQNGTTAVLRCTFDSSEVVTKATSVSWTFQSNQPDSQYYSILYFSDGKAYPGQEEFKHRVQFVGDINKKDASIQLSPAQFSDNGTFFCDVKNPPDVSGTQGRTELRVVQKAALFHVPITHCFYFCLVSRHVCLCYFDCALLVARHHCKSSEAPRPLKKAESSREGTRSTSPSGPLQGPVIYVQLDHSGSKNSFHKMEPVVYADIRKN